MNRFIAVIAATFVVAAACFMPNTDVIADDKSCVTIETVFARGSGQTLSENESKRFKNQMETAIKKPHTQSFYELGTAKHNNNQYLAVDVSNWRNGNAVGAALSAGMANDYGKSVKQGVNELKAYLAERYKKCKSSNTYFVLAGYSQGAQVIGQALPDISPEIRSRILFAGLFGDPKLYLPEGVGVRAPACRGNDLSLYRRTIGNCNVDSGSLGARKPYLPSDMNWKTGLWCYAHDFICGSSSFAWDVDGHGQYAKEDKAIDRAVIEVTDRLNSELTPDDTNVPAETVANTDVVFIIDTTGSMGWKIEQARAFAANSAERVRAMNGRVALVSYRDVNDEYTARIDSPFSTTTTDFQAKVNALTVNGGGDDPEATLHALMTSFNGLAWRDGASKAAVVLTDANFHNPDFVDGSTVASVAKRSLEIDPVNVYPVVPSYVSGAYQELADLTSGQVIIDEGDSESALFDALGKIEQRPVVILKTVEYSAEPGEEITFDASDSYMKNGKISAYRWDFDGDGTFEEVTTTPLVKYTYNVPFAGAMQVQLASENGAIANGSAAVEIAYLPVPTAITVPQNLQIIASDSSSAKIAWNSGGALPDSWVITVNDVPVGTVATDKTSITITDLARTDDVQLSVAGMTSDGEVSDYAAVVLKKEAVTASVGADSSPLVHSAPVVARTVQKSTGLLYVRSDTALTSTDSQAELNSATASKGDKTLDVVNKSTTKTPTEEDNSGSNLLVKGVFIGGIAVVLWLVWKIMRKLRAKKG